MGERLMDRGVVRIGEWSRSISNARSALIEWRAIKMPFACSISARRPRFWISGMATRTP